MGVRIQIHNGTFKYQASIHQPIFKDISLSIFSGEIFFLLGPNGSGKSTLLKCLSGILQVNSGVVVLDNMDMSKLSPKQVAHKLAYVPQSLISAFPFLVKDIVVMGRAARLSLLATPSPDDMAVAEHAMEKIGISHLSNRPCNRISGGEWQLVLIARAMTQLPEILVLDEPTSHLDLGNQIKILSVINQLAKEGLTIIMASHFPDHAFLHDCQVAILKDGTILQSGVPGTVITEKSLREAYGISVSVMYIQDAVGRTVCIPHLT